MNIIETYSININNIHIGNELKPNEAIIVCNHYIMEQLSKKGVTFDEMYPGVFIVTSLNGNSTMQDIEKINRLIRLYNPELMDESNLVAQMSQEKMDAFFQNHFWSDREKKKMHIKSVEYRGNRFDIDQGSLIVTYQEGKRGKEFTFNFRDGSTNLLGYTEDGVRIEDVWDRYLFDETVKPWLEKNKLRLSLEVHNSPTVLNNQNKASVTRTIELEEK